MGRISLNNCSYFPHDADMRNHRKVKALRQKFTNGYAIWSMLLEYITNADGNVFENSDMEFELMSGDFGFPVTEIRDVVNYCIKLEMLFEKDGFYYSESLNERLAPVYVKRGKAKELSKKQSRTNGRFTTNNTEPSHITVTEKPQSKVKYSKENKSKENKSKENSYSASAEATPRKVSDKLYPRMVEVYDSFCKEFTGAGSKMDGGEGKAMKEIIAYLDKNVTDKNGSRDEEVMAAWSYIFQHWRDLDAFTQKSITLKKINSNIQSILAQLKNGKLTGKTETKGQAAVRANEALLADIKSRGSKS